MDIANLPRYEMGRCVSCGDCNREPAYVDEDGEWVKFEDVKEFLKTPTNSKSMPLLPRKKCEYIGELAYRCSRGDKAGYCDRCQ